MLPLLRKEVAQFIGRELCAEVGPWAAECHHARERSRSVALDLYLPYALSVAESLRNLQDKICVLRLALGQPSAIMCALGI